MFDANGDGDFIDAGETITVYDSATAVLSGLPRLTLPLSVAVVDADAACPADLTGEGELNIDDVLGFLDAFVLEEPAADFAEPFGTFNIDDVLGFLDAFAAGCP